jgi:diguanylate cyclase (GGDEF)-like protein
MSPPFLKRRTGWLPAAVVLAVVLITGSRLIMLSVQQHAETAREASRAEATRAALSIESQLQVLTGLASRQAARAAAAISGDAAPQSLAEVPPIHNTFWIATDGMLVASRDSSVTIAKGIVSEWASTAPLRNASAPSVLGPMREGSQWLVAARAPIRPAGSNPAAPPAAWAIAYVDLDQLLSSTHLGAIVDAGYDFALTQVEPASGRSRIFLSSRTTPLDVAAERTIHLPAGYLPAIAGSYLQIAIRPRAGWYPTEELATEIGLLAVLAWLLAFGTHDLTHSLLRLRAGLAASRRRVQALTQRLSSEIEQRQDLQKSFDHARYHDGFTGLPNRRYFMNQLDRALGDVRTRRRQRIGIILIDIARFRLINDTLGHTAGDELMVQASRRFAKATAAFECVLARWSGDQFAVLILDLPSPEAAIALAGVLQEALHAPFDLRRHRLSVTASMGITCADSGPQRAEDVLREADIALSVAKRHETTKTVAYVAAMGGQAATLVSLEADLHVALAKNELRLMFQPIVDLRSYRMVGAEVLLRWRHPVEGLLTPDKFLSIAEEAGLMVPVTRRIILRVCKLAMEWRRRLPPGQEFYLSINLSAAVLRDPGFSDYVESVLQETELPATSLKFELTEATLISNVGAAREVLERLHRMGVQLMLDDFGTGYSSLNYLQLFPLDYVKIDRPFINRTGSEDANTGMTQAMLQMAPSLGLTAIAEIIETEAAANALRQMGCAFGQGYFFSEPVAAELALQFLRGQPFQARQPAAGAIDGGAAVVAPIAAPPAIVAPPISPREDDSPTMAMPPLSHGDMDDDEPAILVRPANRPQRTTG